MFRALIYGSYQKPRELIWIFGMLIFVVLMAEAFMGYLLPWGQMSFWGATVITNLLGALPLLFALELVSGPAAVDLGAALADWFAGNVTSGSIILMEVRLPRALLALIVGQIGLHATMAGVRMAAPLQALREGHSAWSVGVLLALYAAAPVLLSATASAPLPFRM